jgi:hypothetical protein
LDLRAEIGVRWTSNGKLDGYDTIYEVGANNNRKLASKDYYAFSGVSVSYILQNKEKCPTPKRGHKKRFLLF